MKRIRPRHVLLGGALAVAALIWVADHFRGGPRQTASAQAVAPPGAKSVQWHDVTAHVERLATAKYASVASDLDALERDLFAPTPAMEAALLQAGGPDAGSAPLPGAAARPPDFADRHTLEGVILGPRPMAVVDGRLLSPGESLDAHTLVEIHRDRVVFERRDGSERVTLSLPQRPKKP